MLRSLFNGLIEILYPKACLVCKRRLKNIENVDEMVCAQCWEAIKINLPPFCHRCGRHLEGRSIVKNICPKCLKAQLHFDRAFSPCAYEGPLKELIHEFKYKGKNYLAPTLSRLMVDFVKEYNVPVNDIDLIIPVPLHKTRLREREFNQAEALSSHIAREFNKELVPGALKRFRHTKTQTSLEANERLLNVKGSFLAVQKDEVKGKNILLVDDVLTTGATCSEAACALKNAGSGIVFVLTLAN